MKDLMQLAWRGLKQKRKLTLLMVLNLAVGITLLLTMGTIVTRSGHSPIDQRADRVYHVSLNFMDPEFDRRSEFRSPPLTFRDAGALAEAFSANDTTRISFNYTTSFVLDLPDNSVRPVTAEASAADPQYFDLLQVPFIYGAPWREDMQDTAVIVLDKKANDLLFGGANSIGKQVVINNRQLEVVGVMDMSAYLRRFQNMRFQARANDMAVIPLGYAHANNLPRTGYMPCRTKEEAARTRYRREDVQGLKSAECGYLHAWAVLDPMQHDNSHAELTLWMRNYTQQQASQGRFGHSEPYYLTQLASLNDRMSDNLYWEQIYLKFAYLLFAICLINTIGILLAKNQSRAKLVSLYRALGANKLYILKVQLLELSMLSSAAIALGLLLAQFGLVAMFHLALYQADYLADAEQVRRMYSMDTLFALQAAVGIFVAIFAAGLYPIIKASRTAPAAQLRG
ncbi:ABC transporter permease [Pseudoalteromonas viridis]|uniref:ABC transporter permease n=1 Tax=Pseudoalteromonas viridis TaxID=339617 RepID=A0ABX7V0R5_9GAMM|nr:ABC transporter permease [Pseudoalteromonas viridis]QTL34448.1 ABC transporter permease [Pseudoalteromonas viridis]